MYNEEECIRRCQAGKTDAFEGIVQAYEKKIYNLAFRMTGNHEDANDLAQEAFVKVYHSISTFRGDAKFSTWLYRIATNVCLDELRRKGRRKVEHLDEPVFTEDGAMEREIPDWSANPEEAFETREIQNMVQNGMKQLPDEQRIALVLRDIQGYSYEEISEMLNLSLGTVKSRINRGRLALKELLSKDRELFFLSPRHNERRG
jgi:RNA polymerase sigma-70 factor (ECF subfamily)